MLVAMVELITLCLLWFPQLEITRTNTEFGPKHAVRAATYISNLTNKYSSQITCNWKLDELTNVGSSDDWR